MSRHVLIVDDEASFRFSAGIALRQAGYKVSEAGDGEEGLMKILSHYRLGDPFDLALLDILMPKMNGIDLYDALKERGIELPVMFISGYADYSMIKSLEKKSPFHLLRKPFEVIHLLRSIEMMVN
ncbi:MAG: response regulator [Nitrospirae bacterium]|nr:response regulator [Nitrospirota bacterium]